MIDSFEYFEWLYYQATGKSYVDDDPHEKLSYRQLLVFLYFKPFEWFIDTDGDRAMDGVALREDYIIDTEDEIDEDAPCSMLEMMVAFANRLEYSIPHKMTNILNSQKIFNSMLINMGLISYTDSEFDEYEIELIVDDVLHRRYDEDPYCPCMFPSQVNNRSEGLDLWYQASAWLYENYGI